MKIIISIFTMALLASCTTTNVKDWSDEQIETWLTDSQWSKGLSMKPDASINKRAFVEQNILNPESWEAAYNFLNDKDLNALELGRYVIHDNGTYVNVEEYITKDSAHFEAHRKFIDIQYLAKGKEYIHVSSIEPDKQTEVQAYSEEKDIEFFHKEDFTAHLLSGNNFLVMFPSDGHKPCMKVEENEPVRKVVVKIPYVE